MPLAHSNNTPRTPWGWIAPMLIFLAGMFLFTSWKLVSLELRAGAASDPVRLASIILFVVPYLTLGAVLFWTLLRPSLTKFTDAGVSQRTLHGHVSVAWHEATEVREVANGRVIEICAGGRAVRILPMIYSDWSAVSQWIGERLPPDVAQNVRTN